MRISRNQIAVYWAPTGKDAYGVTYGTPVEVGVRWEDRPELFVNQQGQEERSTSVAYPASDVVLNGRMWLGRLADLPSSQSPDAVNALTIKSIYRCPNIRATETLVKIWL